MKLAPTGFAILTGMSISTSDSIFIPLALLFSTILFSYMPKRFEVESDV